MSSTNSELEKRLRQQEILSDFGVEALRANDYRNTLQLAVKMCSDGMNVGFAKVLRPRKIEGDLLVVAGIGWKDGVVGHATIGADLESPAGYALKTGEPVILNHLGSETRFRTPQLMVDHDIKSAVNVLITVSGERYGVLEVDSQNDGEFGKADLVFLTGFANLLGLAIERESAEQKLQDSIEYQKLLTKEASHRVKNSLSIVSALLSLQSQQSQNPQVQEALKDTQARIMAIAKAHDQLWRHDNVGMVATQSFCSAMINQLQTHSPELQLILECDSFDIEADKAIPMGLLLTELVTNAIKHAYPTGSGVIQVNVTLKGDSISLIVEDDGVGLPDGASFEAGQAQSLGVRMIASLVHQLAAEISIDDRNGTKVTVNFPHR